jgi:hypothetical protein
MRWRVPLLVGMLTLVAPAAPLGAQTADVPVLAREQILVVPVALQASPAQQTVPKNTATAVNVRLALPAGVGAPPLPADALVFAQLRGPAFGTPVVLTARPNEPISIPPLALTGLYALENIRLVSGGRTLLQAVPDAVTIEVIDQVLVSQVTSRPLSAQEIKDKGIVVDQTNFQVVNFTAAFGLEGRKVSVDFPMILPTQRGLTAPAAVPALSLPPLQQTGAAVTAAQLPQLQLALQVPNVSVSGLLLRVEDSELEDRFLIPSIPAAIIIPGNVAFLNQFFSVMLMVSNVAPGQSSLVVRDIKAEIVLPPGKDTVHDTGDDPLRMAVEGTPPAPQPKTLPVVQPGPDGKLGTSDDIPSVGPGQSGNAEFLVEGRQEGTYQVQINISGVLDGLPVGPVKISGSATGMVEVRNPTFALTLSQPATVSAGEEYDFEVIVTNTSETPANFVSLSLLPRSISGAVLLSDQAVSIDTIAPGDSVTATFRLLAQQTGTVTSTSFSSDGIPGKFELTTAVGALGIPMSPNTLVLPPAADALPKALRDAAVGLLGQAFALATSPVTPSGLTPITQQIVYDRATDVAAAGQRLRLGEPLLSVVRDLALAFLGNGFGRIAEQFPSDPNRQAVAQQDDLGFDELLRQSKRGATLLQALGDVLGSDVAARGPLAFQASFAQATTSAQPYISAVTGSKTGALPVVLNVSNAAGARVGLPAGGAAVARNVRFGGFFSLAGASPSQLVLVAVPGQTTYTIEMVGTATGTFDLGLVVPEGNRLRRLTWEDVPIAAGGKARVTFTPGADNQYLLQIDDNGDGVPDRQLVALTTDLLTDTGPALLAAVQVVTGKDDQSRFGQLVGLVFSEEISAASSQSGLEPVAITNYAVEGNQVLGVALQPGGRVVLLALLDGLGPFVTRHATVSGLADRLGNLMSPTTVPIGTTLTDGSAVSGQVRRGDGTLVPRARIRLGQAVDAGSLETTVTVKDADALGHYAFDFVRSLASTFEAIDGETGERGSAKIQVRPGARLNVDIILLGTGRLVGLALAPDGTPLGGAVVRVTSLTNFDVVGAVADASGAFSLTGIPVGNVTIEAAHVPTNSRTVVAATVAAGGTLVRNLTLIPLAQAQVETGAVKGQVFRSDGVTPAAGIPVFTDRGGVFTTDATGSYRIDGLTPGPVSVRAIDQARLEQGTVATTVVPGVEITANLILFGGTGTVTGVVLDADGHPVAGVQVGGGLSIATTDANGQFTLADVPIGQRTLTALDPARQLTGSATINLAGPGEILTVQVSLEARATLAGRVFEAGGATAVTGLRVFLLGPTNQSAVTDAGGAFRFANIPLGTYKVSAFRPDFSDGNVVDARLVFKDEVRAVDVIFRGKGRVTGRVLAADGVTALGARVGFSELQVVTGSLAPAENPRCEIQGNIQVGDVTVEVPQCVPVVIGFGQQHLTRVINNNVAAGTFVFDNVFVGPFTVEAVNAFSPTVMAASGAIAKAGDTVDVTLKLVATSAVAGTVFQPDGVTPVGKDVVVTFDSSTLRDVKVVTDEHGRYSLPLVNAGAFTVTAEDPVTGLVGQATGAVDPGRTAEIPLRILGTGTVTVQVQGSGGPISGAVVTLTHGGFPSGQRQRITVTDGTVTFAGGDAVAEGQFSVSAFDPASGLNGFAGGSIAGPDAHANVLITMPDEAGTVRGRFLQPDASKPVPNAQVHLSAAGGEAFATTDGGGQFVFEGVRRGGFTLDAFDPVTARRGRSTGQVSANLEVVTADILEVPQGTVTGFVRLSKDLSPVANADVSLSAGGVFGGNLRTTSGVDGAFSFPGVSAGGFSVSARDTLSGISGGASGTLASEGQIVPLDVVLQVPVVGRIEGVVTAADGSPAIGAQVALDGAFPTTVDNTGFYFFERVPAGRHALLATAALGADAGVGAGEVAFDGDVSRVDIRLIGTGHVAGTVKSGAGDVVEFARVVLTRKTAVPRSFAAETLTDVAGRFAFDGVPVGDVSVTATQSGTLLAGSASGALGPAGGSLDLAVILQPAGAIRGRVLREDGVRPAASMALELADGSHRFGSTDADGRFEFADLSLGAYVLAVSDPVGSGIAAAGATLTAQGQIADLGNIVLDETPPSVVSITPADGASGVPVTTVIDVRFSEPVSPATVGAPNLLVSGPSGAVAGAWTLSADQTRAFFTPAAPYRDFSPISVKVRTGIRDRVGKPLVAEAVATFVTADSQPPTVTSLSPAASARDVPVAAVVRVAYSKTIDPSRFAGAAVVLSRNGAAVQGRLDVVLGNTALVFTPFAPLSPNATYRVDVLAASDVFGNTQSAPLAYTFATLDTEPPIVQALTAAGGSSVPPGATATITADIGGATDVAFVEFLVNGQLVLTQRSAPFSLALAITAALGPAPIVTARATDLSGNVGPFQTLTLSVQPDVPPTAAIIAPAGGATVATGAPITVTVRAADDFGVAQVVFQATGAVTASLTAALSPAATSRDVPFTIFVPAGAAPGSTVTLRATAVDTRGQTSLVASVSVIVGDSTPPTVRIVSPATQSQVAPGDTVSVLVSADDNGQVASLSLEATGVAAFSETRTVSPAQPSVATTFQVPIPPTATAGQTVVLTARAQDAAGNPASIAISLRIRDLVPPSVTLAVVGGSTTVTAGKSVTVRATATDNVAVAGVDFQATGTVTDARSVAVVPAPSATADFTITVPFAAPDGASIVVTGRARDASGNVGPDAMLNLVVAGDRTPPAVTVLSPADGAQVGLGQSVTLTARATDDVAVGQITFTATGVVSGGETRTITPAVTPAETSFTVAVPLDTTPGIITFSVTARDPAGNVSAPAIRAVQVFDSIVPAVQITSPAPGAVIDPRTPLSVTVSATDNVGVTEITLSAAGVTSASETRPISPVASSRTEAFSVNFASLPPTGGSLTLDARARDAAGNQGTAVSVAVVVRDVVPPTVAEVNPSPAATGVDPNTTVTVRFSEAVARATVSESAVRLTTPAGAVPVTFTFSDGDRIVTLTPVSRPLSLRTTVTLTVGTGVTDVAGNALAQTFTSTFTTTSPDVIPPRVAVVIPADGATEVSVAAAIQVTFTEAIDTGTISPASFAVTAGSAPVAGSFAFLDGDTRVRFTPSALLPFGTRVSVILTRAITDLAGNGLADAAGNPLTQPLTFAFTTGTFAITRPAAGSSVPEKTRISLEARGSDSLGIATVTFAVNDQALPPASTAPFATPFVTPPAATTPTLTISAVARTANGSVIAQDQMVVNVVVGLSIEPRLLGVAVGASGTLRLELTSPLTGDLAVDLAAADPTVVTLAPGPVVITAGQTERLVTLTGAAVGNTTVIATSSLGFAGAIVSVSVPVSQQTVRVEAPAIGLVAQPPRSLGRLLAPASGQQALTVPLLPTPATVDTPVTVTSSDPGVAAVVGAVVVRAGSQTATLTITTGAAGTALLTLRAGTEVRGLTVIVGTPPAGSVPPIVAPPVEVTVLRPTSLGQLVAPASGQQTLTVPLLPTPATVDTPVTVTSSDPAVATVVGAVVVRAGSQTATLTITTGTAGTALLTLRAGTEVRGLTVIVGTPPPGTVPPVVAPPVEVTVLRPTSLGQLVAPVSGRQALTVPLLLTPAAVDTPVTVTSSDPAVATVVGTVVVRAGSQTATLTITTGTAGTALLTLRAGTEVRGLTVIVGTPPAGSVPPIVAPPVEVTVLRPTSLGQLVAPVSGQQALTVPLLPTPAAVDTPVTVTSSDPAVATVVGTVVVRAGSQTATLTITTGTAGTALLTLRAGTEVRGLTVIVGTPPPGTVPPIVASPVGVVVLPAASAGRLMVPGSGQQTLTMPLLPTPAAVDTPVTVTSSDPAVATVLGAVVVRAGSQTATLTITTGMRGVAFLRMAAGAEVRELTVIVGTPPAGSVPPILAPAAGVVVQPAPSAGQLIVPGSGQQTLIVPLLPTPAPVDTPVTVRTSDPGVATVAGAVVIPAGGQVATIKIISGTPGIAILTMTAGTEVRELTVIVGTPPAGSVPPIVAPPVQIDVTK